MSSDFTESDWLARNTTGLTGEQLVEFLGGMTAADGTNYLDMYLEAQAEVDQ